MILHAMLEQTPPDGTGKDDMPTREVKVEASSYDEARDRLFSDLPEGWRVLWVRTA